MQNTPGDLRQWFEEGNRLLEKGDYAPARAEFEKVVAALPPQQRPRALQSIAHCFFLENRPDDAAHVLKRALLLAPRHDIIRQILVETLESVERGSEARTWLDRLDTADLLELGREMQPPLPQDELALLEALASRPPPEAPTAHRKGRFRIAFSERSPSSALEVYLERSRSTLGDIAAVDPALGEYDLAQESYEVYVPASYSPATPAGLLVWVGAGRSGGIARPDNLPVLADRQLLWIGANESGNERRPWYRVGLALDAVHNMKSLYSIDEERIYVGGYSGGGRVAISLALLYPEVFRGGAFFFGAGYFKKVSAPGKPGTHWEPAFAAPEPQALDLARRRSRLALVTGEHDFNRDETEADYRALQEDGFQHVSYFEIPGARHGYGVRGEWLAQVIDTLDQPASRVLSVPPD